MPIQVIVNPIIDLLPIFIKTNDPTSAKEAKEALDYMPYIFITKLNDPKSPPVTGTTIDPRDIIFVKLHNSHFLPEIELYCEDSKGILFNDLYPYDHDTVVSIYIQSNANTNAEKPIRMDFRVASYETAKIDEQKHAYKFLIKGVLDVDQLNYSLYESRKGTSFNVIKDISTKLGLGFASNVQSSNDSMTWINPSDTYKEWIKDITKYSYISDTSFVWTFIDFYYNVNYVDIQVEMNQFIPEQQTFNNPLIQNVPKYENVPLYLTNNSQALGTNKYISKFNVVNQSYQVNLEKFYKMKGTWYVKNINTVYKQEIKELETDPKNLYSIIQLADKKSKLYQGYNTNDEYFIGKMDTDNKYKYYSYAKVANKYNLDNMEKEKIIITLNIINFAIKRFQNILIEIFNLDDLFSEKAKTTKPTQNINAVLSGYWYVTGINYIFKRNGGVEQEITLMRRDLSLDYGKSANQQNDLTAMKNNNTNANTINNNANNVNNSNTNSNSSSPLTPLKSSGNPAVDWAQKLTKVNIPGVGTGTMLPNLPPGTVRNPSTGNGSTSGISFPGFGGGQFGGGGAGGSW